MSNWKERAIERSEAITDAWEVTKNYAGRIAEWVLFFCMIANIIEMLPGVVLWSIATNIILGVQVVSLDIAGFGLASMADHAKQRGDLEAAKSGARTAKFLIGLMIVTLLLVSVGVLFPDAKVYTDYGEKGLILVRVIMMVVYGHVVHGLRRSATNARQGQMQADALALQVAGLAKELAQMNQSLQNRVNESSAMIERNLQTRLAPILASTSTLQDQLALLPDLQATASSLQVKMQGESAALSGLQKDLQVMQAQVKRLVDEASAKAIETPVERTERPLLRALPKPEPVQEELAERKFNARSFVFACLQNNLQCKLSEMRELAKLQGQELSESTISRYRKEYLQASASSKLQASASSDGLANELAMGE